MAKLLHRQSGTAHVLLAEYLVGRGTTCHLRLDGRSVSSTHAQIRWTGTTWEIRDLDSKNGTFVDGRRLERGERLAVEAGARIGFGASEATFELADDSPPVAHAVDESGSVRRIQDQMLFVPDADNPVYTVFEHRETWMLENSEGDQRKVRDGEVLQVDGQSWTLHLPVVVEKTAGPDVTQPSLNQLTARFSVSRDQEHIDLTLVADGNTITLASRVHMEFLLRLAEARLHDQQSGDMSADEEGWMYVPELLRQLGVSDDASGRNLLCQHICQARKQFSGAKVVNAMDLVQRRRTIATEGSRRVGQIRIGIRQLEIA